MSRMLKTIFMEEDEDPGAWGFVLDPEHLALLADMSMYVQRKRWPWQKVIL